MLTTVTTYIVHTHSLSLFFLPYRILSPSLTHTRTHTHTHTQPSSGRSRQPPASTRSSRASDHDKPFLCKCMATMYGYNVYTPPLTVHTCESNGVFRWDKVCCFHFSNKYFTGRKIIMLCVSLGAWVQENKKMLLNVA